MTNARFQASVPVSYAPRSYAEGKKIGLVDLASALWCIICHGLRD